MYWHHNHSPQPTASIALNTPIPTISKTKVELEINSFYELIEFQYEELINRHMVGDCLVFQGKKR